jgi:hypothetical protein
MRRGGLTKVEVKVMPEQSSPEFKREKWRTEHELRKDQHEIRKGEHELRTREVDIKERHGTRWLITIGAGIVAALVTAVGNIALEDKRAAATRLLEEDKAEATRILEMIKTGDREKAADNLKFLLDAGLISNSDRRALIRAFLIDRGASQGPVLPVPPAAE